MGLEGGPVGAGQGHVHKVLARVEVAEGGGHVHREVVPLEAVLLSDAHGGGVCLQLANCNATRTTAQHSGKSAKKDGKKLGKNFVNPDSTKFTKAMLRVLVLLGSISKGIGIQVQ